jgi:hypothetical protein
MKLDREGRGWAIPGILFVVVGLIGKITEAEALRALRPGFLIFLGVVYLFIAYFPVILAQDKD